MFPFYFLHFFFLFVWERNFKIFLSPPLSLSLRLSGFSFFSFFFFVVVACWCCCLLVTIRADGVLSRIADDEMLKIVLLRIKTIHRRRKRWSRWTKSSKREIRRRLRRNPPLLRLGSCPPRIRIIRNKTVARRRNKKKN